MLTRGRIVALVAICVLSLAAAAIYVTRSQLAVEAGAAEGESADTSADVQALLSKPHIVFRSTVLGQTYGRLGVVSVEDPAGPRGLLNSVCERAYATDSTGVCITSERGVVPAYAVTMLDDHLQPTASTDLAGLPSRARISADGSLVATTTFVTGHSYASSSFSTETIVRHSGAPVGNMEDFSAIVDGIDLKAVDRNFWGVTFGNDDDTFYVTAASGGKTWLMKGSLRDRAMTSVHEDAECPSLSPDGTKIAYKKRLGNKTPGVWRLAVLDLATGDETLLAEQRSVDDQVEWLDGDHLLYAMSRPAEQGTVSDVWQVPADGAGKPSVLVPEASSPAVVRAVNP